MVPRAEIPPDVVTMGSTVRLTDLQTGEEETYTLVYPNDADIDENKLSVLAPIGTALLGYRAGDVVEWPVPAGVRRFRVEEVLSQPARALAPFPPGNGGTAARPRQGSTSSRWRFDDVDRSGGPTPGGTRPTPGLPRGRRIRSQRSIAPATAEGRHAWAWSGACGAGRRPCSFRRRGSGLDTLQGGRKGRGRLRFTRPSDRTRPAGRTRRRVRPQPPSAGRRGRAAG